MDLTTTPSATSCLARPIPNPALRALGQVGLVGALLGALSAVVVLATPPDGHP